MQEFKDALEKNNIEKAKKGLDALDLKQKEEILLNTFENIVTNLGLASNVESDIFRQLHLIVNLMSVSQRNEVAVSLGKNDPFFQSYYTGVGFSAILDILREYPDVKEAAEGSGDHYKSMMKLLFNALSKDQKELFEKEQGKYKKEIDAILKSDASRIDSFNALEMLLEAIKKDNISDLETFFDQGPKNISEILNNVFPNNQFPLVRNLIEYAVENGSAASVDFLLKNKISIPDTFKDEVINKAINKRNKQIIASLISSDLYISNLDKYLDNLFLLNFPEGLEAIFQHKQVNPMTPLAFGYTLLDLARRYRNRMSVLVLKKAESQYQEPPEMAKFRHQIFILKSTGHLLGVSKTTTLTRPDNHSTFNIISHAYQSYLGISLLHDRTAAYLKSIQQENKESKEENKDNVEREKQFTQIEAALLDAQDFLSCEQTMLESSEKLISRFKKQGDFIIIPKSISDHDLTIGLMGDYLIYSNRGYSEKLLGTFVFKIKDKSKINKEFIIKLLINSTLKEIEETVLSVIEEDFILKLPSKPHKRGTCTVSNPKSCVEGALFVYYYMLTGNKKLALEYAEREQKRYTTFLRNDQVERLVADLNGTQGEDRAWRLENIIAIITAHHAQANVTSTETPRQHVPRAIKLKNELKRELRLLTALTKPERIAVIKILEGRIKEGLLIPAILNGDRELAQFLISHGAKLDTKDSSGSTPMEIAKAMSMEDLQWDVSQETKERKGELKPNEGLVLTDYERTKKTNGATLGSSDAESKEKKQEPRTPGS